MKRLRRSFLKRLLLTELAAVMIAWGILLIWIYLSVARLGTGDLDRQMHFFAEALAEFSRTERNDPARLANSVETLERFYINYGVNYDAPVPGYQAVYQLWDRSGQLLYKSAAAPIERLSPIDQGFSEETFAGQRWRVVSVLSQDARLLVQVAERLDIRQEMIEPILVYLLTPLLWILPIIGVLTWFAVARGLYPLRDLANEVAARTPYDMRPLQPLLSYAETAPLVHEINELLGRLRQALETERSFTADAAHELRTPLAVIGVQAHVLAQSCRGEQEALQDLQQSVERAGSLVRQLLTLARLDSQGFALQRRRHDLDALVRERIAVLARRGLEKQIEVEMLSSGSLAVSIDWESFVSVIDNLIDNAFRYTPVGGHVQVSLESTETHARLRIADDGPGIPPAEREKVFQRFYRLPGMEMVGSGLGLAIVRRIIALHGASIRLAQGLDGRGLGVEIMLPHNWSDSTNSDGLA